MEPRPVLGPKANVFRPEIDLPEASRLAAGGRFPLS